MRRVSFPILLMYMSVVLFGALGCGSQQAEPPAVQQPAPLGQATSAEQPGPQPAPAISTSPAKVAPDVTDVTVVDEKGLAEAIAAKKGSVVLVDYWATWCPPCKELFPHTVELAKKYRDRGLVVFTLSFDDPEEKDTVVAYLRRFEAVTENYLAKYGASSKSVEAFAVTNGALPHYKLYDRQGNLRQEIASGGKPITPEMIEAAVEELLKE
ncbi:MAG: thioredoxin domain-containing protein [Thermoguttaceae bacterium]|nr:thioredoxin domain-containing protein [Thermoguttaceae bacterium]MDW8077984.1 thioredoxin domain-containing protein [Thermoguttaceae bacterium]